MNCEGIITRGLFKECSNHPNGFERVGIIMNRGDIDWNAVTIASGTTNVVGTFALNNGATGFKVLQYGTKPFNGTKKSGVSKEAAPGKMTKTVQFFVPDREPTVDENFIDALLNGEFVMILETKDKGSRNDAAFEFFGFHNGLHFTAIEQDNYGDYGSGWLVTMEETEAPASSMYLFKTSYAATKTLFLGLLGQ